MHKDRILAILGDVQTHEAIAIIESIGKELRKKNSIRINKKIGQESLNLDRTIKPKKRMKKTFKSHPFPNRKK
jgi:hypothetical protein